MKFSEFKYERPSYEEFKGKLMSLIDELKNADNLESQYEYIGKTNAVRNHIQTMSTIAGIRHTINTADEYYDKEQSYWDEYGPLYSEIDSIFYRVLVNSKFRSELEERLGKQFFTLAEFSLKSFSPEVIGDLQIENKLSSEYTKLIASAKIMF